MERRNDLSAGGQLPLRIGLRDSATFENFVPGPNHPVVTLLRSGEERVVFLWGAPGTGKTHLLQAACRASSDRGDPVAYLPLGRLDGLRPAILEGLEESPLVCLDETQGVAGSPEWEEALFHFFNRLRDAGGRLIAAADRSPARLDLRLPDLRSRLGWGPVYQLQPLNDKQKVEAMRQRLGRRGLELTTEVASYLLRRCPRDMHSLFELVERLDRASLVAKRRLTVPFVRDCLAPP